MDKGGPSAREHGACVDRDDCSNPWAYFKMMLPASIVLVIVAATNANLTAPTKTTENEIYQLFGVLFAANFHSVRTHFDLWRTDDS